MKSRSLAREVSLLFLGQISEDHLKNYNTISLDDILNMALDTLMTHWREQLDYCAIQIELGQQELLNSEIYESDNLKKARVHLTKCLEQSENIINILSDTFELSRLLTLSDQDNIRKEAINRVDLVIKNFTDINSSLDSVMDGWRLKRLPRIDQDILRLAYVDLYNLKTPIPVTCNEAVNLANRYSDDQGRKMINGVLRRLQNRFS
ncbi:MULTISPECIES: transcription antitermination factor NusB [unclassified Prochlorococcus]|uniref:transcription antitermination factor NusB n=1 Tax=unclassified Prochlorococcus TaxID=2627481 RepID=UPI0005337313|nr:MULTISPECIES: transcription antitermination factor NusB [unclassified Prochlorococcus]KGG14488.1 Transcription termination protein NusB [Prochlorococcus sp. MIT 0602]